MLLEVIGAGRAAEVQGLAVDVDASMGGLDAKDGAAHGTMGALADLRAGLRNDVGGRPLDVHPAALLAAGTDLYVSGLGRNKVQHVVLELRDAPALRIPIGYPRWDDDQSAALLRRIRDANEVYRSGVAGEAALLQRGDRPHRTWVAVLRSGGLGTLRTAALSKDKLWRVIEDASAGPLERAAAAVALGKDLGAEERRRLERAARATAAPKLRVVLETAADAEDEQLAEHLEALERPPKKQARGGP